MAVSEERIDELLRNMLNNADEDGWCHIPDNLTEDEEDELSKRLAIITMQDRIDDLLQAILNVIKYINSVDDNLDEYDIMEKLKIKDGLETIKEDSQNILMDLHSDDIITDFFRVMVIGEEEDERLEALKAKEDMKLLVDTEFKEQLDDIKEYCSTMITMSDDVMVKIKES